MTARTKSATPKPPRKSALFFEFDREALAKPYFPFSSEKDKAGLSQIIGPDSLSRLAQAVSCARFMQGIGNEMMRPRSPKLRTQPLREVLSSIVAFLNACSSLHSKSLLEIEQRLRPEDRQVVPPFAPGQRIAHILSGVVQIKSALDAMIEQLSRESDGKGRPKKIGEIWLTGDVARLLLMKDEKPLNAVRHERFVTTLSLCFAALGYDTVLHLYKRIGESSEAVEVAHSRAREYLEATPSQRKKCMELYNHFFPF